MTLNEKAHFIDRVSREMEIDLTAPGLAPREALAIACRIVAREGHESGLAGQVTARGEQPETWWTLQFGYGFEEATADRMVLVDDDLKPLRGGRPNPGTRFHIWIYRKRPDVKAIIHTHAPYASALAATGQPLKTIHMDSAMLHGTAHLAESRRPSCWPITACWRPGLRWRRRRTSRSSSSVRRACSCGRWPPEGLSR
jgi:L-fuculose-phosphate aldolase